MKYALDSRNPFTRKNAIKVFAFATPPVLNEPGLDLFHRTIGAYNAVCIYRNLDAVPYSSMFFGLFGRDTAYRHVGIQANVSKRIDKVSDVVSEVNKIVTECAADGWSLSSLASTLLKLSLESHYLDSFSCEAVREVMQRMRGNYKTNPYMDRNKIGRDDFALLKEE